MKWDKTLHLSTMTLLNALHPDVLANPRQLLRELFDVAVSRALPLQNMPAFLPKPPRGRTLVLGAGKAAGAMAHAVEALWPQDAPLSGMVVTRYGHTPRRPEGLPQRLKVVEASHPVPDAAGLAAAEEILSLAQGLTADDLVLCLISGGGSALLSLPALGLSLLDKQHINQALLQCGANISEMNCVRKHLSRIKGGRLAAACAPARVVTLAISDVPGDNPSVIASGPTVPDASSCAEALDILQRYQIDIPPVALMALQSGAWESPKPGDARLSNTTVHLIATPRQSLMAAAALAESKGLKAYVLSDEIEGESRDVGKVHAALARASAQGLGPLTKPCVILSGGETTVTLRNKASRAGRGGRAGEFCMGLALALQGHPGVWAIAADTDGIDGVEDNAGAVVTPDSLLRGKAAGVSLNAHLESNNAYAYFQALNDLVFTGPTHTNVNDFRAILVL
jgi:hydroxypyruvate reductase